jgi:hypothetical protein
MRSFEVFHTQEYRFPILTFPIQGTGNDMWLGDGYYFWQDYEFSKWWGEIMKCKACNKTRRYTIFKATITFTNEEFIDTVFNEEDYYNFVNTVEKFAKMYIKQFHKKPTLEEFNDFIDDYDVWEDISVIRFQDLPFNNDLIKVDGYYYKKRIQFRVNEPEKITNFAQLNTFVCV